MAFYSPDPAMGHTLAAVLSALEAEGRPGLGERLSITWLRYPESLRRQAERLGLEAFWHQRPTGASHGGERLRYPASVVKLVYLAASEAWLQRRLLQRLLMRHLLHRQLRLLRLQLPPLQHQRLLASNSLT